MNFWLAFTVWVEVLCEIVKAIDTGLIVGVLIMSTSVAGAD